MPSPAQHLHKDCEKDDSDDGSEEQVTHGEVLLIQEVAQGEGNGPSKAPIRDDELVLGGQLDNAELVDEPGQDQHTCQEAGRGEVRLSRKSLPLSPSSSLTSWVPQPRSSSSLNPRPQWVFKGFFHLHLF